MHVQKLRDRPPIIYAALIFATLAPLYYISYHYHLLHPYAARGSRSNRYQHGGFYDGDFIADWLGTQLIEPFEPWTIAAYCDRSTWHPNLIFRLDNANGGIGNVRGNTLDFIFQAIEAGASIMLPDRAARSEDDLSNVWGGRAPFDNFFDEAWFLSSMKQACPQMEIFKPYPDQNLVDPLPGNYLPKSRRLDISAENSKDAYLEHFGEWLNSQQNFDPEKATLVSFERTLWDIDTRSLPQGFRRSFGQVLHINPAIRRYAALVVEKLASWYTPAHHMDPSDAIPPLAYFGAHLRIESDAEHAGWLAGPLTNFSAQTDAYIEHALRHDLRVIYAASGNATGLAAFKAKAAMHDPPLNVTSKFELLPPSEAAALQKLSWDQQALVDYEILLRCSVFSGLVKSSFAYNVAMTRNQRLGDLGRVTDPWAVANEEDGVAFDDGVSRIIGRDEWHEQRIPRGMWP